MSVHVPILGTPGLQGGDLRGAGRGLPAGGHRGFVGAVLGRLGTVGGPLGAAGAQHVAS